MTTHDALLAAVLAKPDDDLPRLVYADHLEERNEPGDAERAEWIRYDIAYPHAGFSEMCSKGDIFPYLGLPSLPPVRVTTHHQADAFCRSWMWGDFDDLGVVFHDLTRDMDYRTERGFIHTVRCPLAAWVEHGPAVVAAHPVERVVVTDVNAHDYITLDGVTFFPHQNHTDRLSGFLIRWAKSQPHPARIVTSPVSVDFVTG